MTRKDYQLIASVVRDAPLPGASRVALAKEFADKLLEANPERFNKLLFLAEATRERDLTFQDTAQDIIAEIYKTIKEGHGA